MSKERFAVSGRIVASLAGTGIIATCAALPFCLLSDGELWILRACSKCALYAGIPATILALPACAFIRTSRVVAVRSLAVGGLIALAVFASAMYVVGLPWLDTRVTKVKLEAEALALRLDDYYMANGFYPESLEWLDRSVPRPPPSCFWYSGTRTGFKFMASDRASPFVLWTYTSGRRSWEIMY